jgi:uncharacterized protein YbjT (DUF2867 family)
MEIFMSNTILVTGASGNIGRELIQILRAANANVIAGSSSGKAKPGVPTRKVDLADTATLADGFAGVDTLFLLLPLQSNMLDLARNAVAAAKAAGVKHIVHSSGAGADATSPAMIARVHGEVDQLIKDSGIPYTLTLPVNFMQNYINYHAAAIKAGAFYLPQGEGRVGYIDVRDVAAVNAVILQNPGAHVGKSYVLTGGESLSNADVAQRFSQAIGRPVDYVDVSDEAARAAMTEMGMPEWNIDVMMSLNQVIAAGYAAGLSPSVQELLGRAPISFERYLADNQAALS